MGRYAKPGFLSYDGEAIIDNLHLVQTNGYATVDVYGGRSAKLENNTVIECMVAKADTNYGIIGGKEVSHA